MEHILKIRPGTRRTPKTHTWIALPEYRYPQYSIFTKLKQDRPVLLVLTFIVSTCADRSVSTCADIYRQ